MMSGVLQLPPSDKPCAFCDYLSPDFRRPWADAGLLTDVAAGRPPHALARHVGTRPPHVACAHVGVSQPAGEKRPSARTPAGPGPRRSVAARPIAQARTRSRLICERGACAYQLRKPGLRPPLETRRLGWGVPTILDSDSLLRGSVHARAAAKVQSAVQG